MPALPLLQLAKRACSRNIKSIVDVGDAPYPMVRDALIKVRDPEQLREIEVNSPQISGEDAEIWLIIIKQTIPDWQNKDLHPKSRKGWYKMYKKLYHENEEAVKKDAEKLKAAMDGIKTERASHTSKLVDAKSLPASLRRHTRVGSLIRPTGDSSKRGSAAAVIGSGSRAKALTGHQVVQQARREGKAQGIFAGGRGALNTPTHQLKDKTSTVNSAPLGWSKPNQQPARMIIAPKRLQPTQMPSSAAKHSPIPPDSPLSLAERERRLNAAKAKAGRKRSIDEVDSKSSSTNGYTSSEGAKNPIIPTIEAHEHDELTSKRCYKVPRVENRARSSLSPGKSSSPMAGSPPNGARSGASPSPFHKRQKPPVDPFLRKDARKRLF